MFTASFFQQQLNPRVDQSMTAVDCSMFQTVMASVASRYVMGSSFSVCLHSAGSLEVKGVVIQKDICKVLPVQGRYRWRFLLYILEATPSGDSVS